MKIYIATHYVSGSVSLATADSKDEADKFIVEKLKQENVLFCEIMESVRRYGK